MPDTDSPPSASNAIARSWRARFFALRWPLLAILAVLLYFLATGTLNQIEFLLGLGVVLAATILTGSESPQEGAADAAGDTAPRLSGPQGVSIADALPDPCFLLDRRAVIIHANAAAAQQFPGASVGNPIAFSMRSPDLLTAIENVSEGGAVQTVELHQTVPSATWFKVHVAPLEFSPASGDDAPRGWILVTMQSLTEQKRIEAMRVDFIANASHELRTPLTSLTGFIETLQGSAAKDKKAQEKFLGIMRTQAQRMSNLIDDLLSLSRIELRQHVRPTSKTDIARILYEVVEGLQTQAADAGVEVTLSIPQDRIEVTGDRDELYEVFENLIDNAIKYGADGKKVAITASQSSRASFSHAISVVDYGPGIAEEHVPRLTERFYRVDAESSRKKKGTGLGLAIVKHILARHGGQLNIRSRLGEGTEAQVFLP